ncbi:hypothetical protein D9757_004264 [Collybiopsis confluens]|uniref:Uncharacterized protein n=1 Tax=Collybiopsis confluens TaxID=2823264 RepID=A0A8H5MD81_9AGAR|nr:hypothetical protein D9757_004264 [Collybiopsis confluens]
MSLDSRVVRFDNECVLIPQLRKRPMIVTRTYSLPLWKRSASDVSDDPSSPVLRLPFPNFKATKPLTSPRSEQPPSPCLVHRTPSSPRRLDRRPSLPTSPVLDITGKQLPTVPLRSCCPDCVSITEESLKEGEAWVEKFTKGARRRRNSSVDSQTDCDSVIVRLASIKVDEVDTKRHSGEIAAPRLSPRSSPVILSSPNTATIIEEEEDQLFPLPSPRRTPNASPANSATPSPLPSPSASTSHLSSAQSPDIPDEGILAQSLTRKGRYGQRLLAPDEPTLSISPQPAVETQTIPLASETPSTLIESPPSSPRKSHSISPERRRSSGTKERRPSFGASVLRATGDMLKGISGVSPGPGLGT